MPGSLRPGTFIRLDETAADLGVSITPVREALRTLRGGGMVQLEPHRGHVVVPMTRGDIEDIFWLQATIAEKLAEAATERISEAQIEELEELNSALAEAVDHQDPEEVAFAEFTFHRAFNHAPGGSSWRGSCCMWRGICRPCCTRLIRTGAWRRSRAIAS